MIINKVNELNIKMVKGDSLSFTVQIEGLKVDLDTAYFTVKNNEGDLSPLLQKSLKNGITKVDTDKYLEDKSYFYDLEIRIGDSVHTIVKGLFKLVNDITTN